MSRRCGVTVSTLKYYQREGLVPDGERRHANQVDYGDIHVQRVRLIRALLETGGLTIAAAREILRTLDDKESPMDETFRIAQESLAGGRPLEGSIAASEAASGRVLQLVDERGWCISPDNPGVAVAARALDGLFTIDHDPSAEYLNGYADAAEAAARSDLDALSTVTGRDRTAELMVVGTVMGDPLFSGLRWLAQQNATKGNFADYNRPAKKEE